MLEKVFLIVVLTTHIVATEVSRDVLSCAGKKNGERYVHPKDCSKFIQCEKGRPIDRVCPPCQMNATTCPDGFLHFDPNFKVCNWPRDVNCSTQNTTTEAGQGRSWRITSPQPHKRAAPTNKPGHLPIPFEQVEGDSCNPYNCTIQGYCINYTYCKSEESEFGPMNKVGSLAVGSCIPDHNGTALYFNPKHRGSSVHGGVCDYWLALDNATKATYLKDPECIRAKCEYTQDQPCTINYVYFNGSYGAPKQPFKCGDKLVWDNLRKTCTDPCMAQYIQTTNGTDTTKECSDLLKLDCVKPSTTLRPRPTTPKPTTSTKTYCDPSLVYC